MLLDPGSWLTDELWGQTPCLKKKMIAETLVALRTRVRANPKEIMQWYTLSRKPGTGQLGLGVWFLPREDHGESSQGPRMATKLCGVHTVHRKWITFPLGTLTLVGFPSLALSPLTHFQMCSVTSRHLICLCGTGNDGCLRLTLLGQAEPFLARATGDLGIGPAGNTATLESDTQRVTGGGGGWRGPGVRVWI